MGCDIERDRVTFTTRTGLSALYLLSSSFPNSVLRSGHPAPRRYRVTDSLLRPAGGGGGCATLLGRRGRCGLRFCRKAAHPDKPCCCPWEASGHEWEWRDQGLGAAAVTAQSQPGQPKAQSRLQKAGECLQLVGRLVGTLSLRRQGSSVGGTPGPGGGCLEGCQKIFEDAAAGPGERPGRSRRGKAEEWVAVLYVLALFVPFLCLVAGVCAHPHRELAEEWL